MNVIPVNFQLAPTGKVRTALLQTIAGSPLPAAAQPGEPWYQAVNHPTPHFPRTVPPIPLATAEIPIGTVTVVTANHVRLQSIHVQALRHAIEYQSKLGANVVLVTSEELAAAEHILTCLQTEFAGAGESSTAAGGVAAVRADIQEVHRQFNAPVNFQPAPAPTFVTTLQQSLQSLERMVSNVDRRSILMDTNELLVCSRLMFSC